MGGKGMAHGVRAGWFLPIFLEGLTQSKDSLYLFRDIVRPHEIADDGGAVGAGLPDLSHIILINPADGDDGKGDRLADFLEQGESARGITGLFRSRSENRSEADVVGPALLGLSGLRQIVRRNPDNPFPAHQFPRYI